mmetsp:Transcript_28122/g.72298  ORF Transcript_28122/g.72298 Transcript_28122/m.72298 type:complete len:221 (+) Transcript_28122:503-1165(+)
MQPIRTLAQVPLPSCLHSTSRRQSGLIFVVFLLPYGMPLADLRLWLGVLPLAWAEQNAALQVPCTAKDRAVTLVLIPVAVFIFTNSTKRLADYAVAAERRKREGLMLGKALNLGDVLRMDIDKDGQVSREEYTLFMLTMLGRATPDDIALLHNQFSRLDVTGTGYLDCQDLLKLEQQQAVEAARAGGSAQVAARYADELLDATLDNSGGEIDPLDSVDMY